MGTRKLFQMTQAMGIPLLIKLQKSSNGNLGNYLSVYINQGKYPMIYLTFFFSL